MSLITRTRLVLVVVVVAAFACAVPAAAGAATVTYDQAGVLTYTADSGEKNLFGVSAGGPGKISISDSGASSLDYPGDRCEPGWISYVIDCDVPTSLKVALDDRDDIANGPAEALGLDAVFDGGAGADVLRSDVFGAHPAHLIGGPGDDKLTGGAGADTLDGGDGVDELNGRDASDQVLGGGGDDKLLGDGHNVDAAPDVLDGGPGFDVIESEWAKNLDSVRPIRVTLGGGADDGRDGEGDDVRNVEKLDLTVPGTFVGSDGPDYVDIHQRTESSTLTGNGGDDHLEGSDGDEQVDGGSGNDLLDGGYGNDHITGGPGADVIHGDVAGGECGIVYCKLPAGNDRVDARDGVADQIDCGVGQDSVVADASDVVAPDCETVDRAGGQGGGGQGGGGQGGGGEQGGGGQAGATVQLRFTKTRLRAALAKGVKVRVTAPGAGRVKLTGRRGSKAVASGSGKVAASGTATVTLKFSKAARKQLKRSRSAKIAVGVTFTPAGGAPASNQATLTLRR